jgi:cytoskeletal protein CcmA (bactofilin family)
MAVFGNNSSKTTKAAEFNPNSLNLINSGTEIIGDLISNGDVRIDGMLRGTVHTKAKLVIGSTGMIEGDVKAQNSDISGHVKGNISVDELLTLKANAKVHGDIITKKLVVETGAEFNGKCQMRNETSGKGSASVTNNASPQKA